MEMKISKQTIAQQVIEFIKIKEVAIRFDWEKWSLKRKHKKIVYFLKWDIRHTKVIVQRGGSCSKNIQIDTQTSTAGVAKANKQHAQKNSDQFLNVDGNELPW